jgi:hypothetical protein
VGGTWDYSMSSWQAFHSFLQDFHNSKHATAIKFHISHSPLIILSQYQGIFSWPYGFPETPLQLQPWIQSKVRVKMFPSYPTSLHSCFPLDITILYTLTLTPRTQCRHWLLPHALLSSWRWGLKCVVKNFSSFNIQCSCSLDKYCECLKTVIHILLWFL